MAVAAVATGDRGNEVKIQNEVIGGRGARNLARSILQGGGVFCEGSLLQGGGVSCEEESLVMRGVSREESLARSLSTLGLLLKEYSCA